MGSIPVATTSEAAADAITTAGCVIVAGALDGRERQDLETAVSALEDGRPLGRNVFEGERSHRLYSLVVQGRPFEELTEHPAVVGVLDRLLLPNCLLSNCQSIRLYPGETHQPWHTDDAFYPIPRPRPFPLGISTIWAIDPFTVANGATEAIPGSHRWADEHPDERPDEHLDGDSSDGGDADTGVVVAAMDPGSVLIFDAALWHRGGANQTSGTRLCMTIQYCQPWLRPQESQLLIAPPHVAAGFSPRLQSMVGYNIHPPFIGQVEGKHPLRVIDEDSYRANRGDDAQRAGDILRRPEATFPNR